MGVLSPAYHFIGYVLLICLLLFVEWTKFLPKDVIRDARYSAGIILAITAVIQFLYGYALIKGFNTDYDHVFLINRSSGNNNAIDIALLIGTLFVPLLLLIRRIGSYKPAAIAMTGIILLYFFWNWGWVIPGDSTATPLISTVYQPLIDLGLMMILSSCVLWLIRQWKV